MSRSFWSLGCSVVFFGLATSLLSAQLQHPARSYIDVPQLVLMPAGVSTHPISAAEVATHTAATLAEASAKSTSFRSAHYPIDSILTVIAATGAQWLARIQASSTNGIQLDPAGRVGVVAGREAYAKQQFAERLASPGLTRSDQAFALRTAVEAFSDRYTPGRLPTAEAYLTQLDALGDSVAAWRFEARKALLWTYYLLGRSADVARVGTAAIALLDKMPFVDRRAMYSQIEEQVYSPTVEALTAQPDPRAHIERLNRALRAGAVPAPALMATDSGYVDLGSWYQSNAERMIMGNAKLGTSAAPLIAQYWLNRPSPDSATVPVNDGAIRLIEVAHTGCAPCVHEVYALQRLSQQFPQIQPTLLTWTFGRWGNRLVEREEEVRHLTEYFVTSTKITFPVGIWAGKKVRREDGGMTPEESPNLKDYPLFGKPMLWVVDGHGIIRRVFTGYDREIETQIARTVEFLVRESVAANLARSRN